MLSKPMPQRIQPMGLWGRREATNAPTAGNVNANTSEITEKGGASSLIGMGGVRKSSNHLSAMSATDSPAIAQAIRAAAWLLTIPAPCPGINLSVSSDLSNCALIPYSNPSLQNIYQ